MTHDPLCPCAPINPIRPGTVHTTNTASCQCVRLIQARADERSRCIQEIENYYCPDEDTDYCTGFEDGIRKAIDILDMGRDYG